MTSGAKYPKRLIEADLPIKELSQLRNKRLLTEDVNVRRVGLWWSRKPQHQCRAIWLALMLPDPAAESTSDADLRRLREILLRHSHLSEAGKETSLGLRADLLRFCRELAEPSQACSEQTKKVIKELSETFKFQENVVLDPFAGGGSIPVEALRIGLTTIATEYNPIACLFLRVLLEWGQRLDNGHIESIVKAINSAMDTASEACAELYPKHPTLGQPVGYIRFRRLVCEGPTCGRIIPATSKFELDQRNKVGVVFANLPEKGDSIALKLAIAPPEGFPNPTLRTGSLTCPSCGYTTPRKAIAKQWTKHRLSPQLVAVAYRDNDRLRIIDPLPEQLQAVIEAEKMLTGSELWTYIPRERWPRTEPRRFSPPLYGYTEFSDCHTERQLIFLASLCRSMRSIQELAKSEIATDMAALALAQAVDRYSSFCRWRNDRGGSYENSFAGKSLGMIWDFFEADPLHPEHSLKLVLKDLHCSILAAKAHLIGEGSVIQMAAQDLALPDNAIDVIYTDPPYYDQIPYSHLSDWPFVWMRQVGAFVGRAGPDGLVPKDREVAVDRPHSLSPSTHNETYFKEELRKAFVRLRACIKDDGVGVVVFAHQKTSAWESLLEAILEAGFYVTASWPIDTERGGRLQAQGTASLQSSIHLVVRPRKISQNDRALPQIGEWREVLDQLPVRIHDWMPRLAEEGIVGADAIFACLGPALEIFSRYSRVETFGGQLIPLGDQKDENSNVLQRGFLSYVWETVAKEALTMIFAGADATDFEPDARLTAMWLWTLKTGDANGAESQTEDEEGDEEEGKAKKRKAGGLLLEFDAARKIAQGLGAHLENLNSVVEVAGETARLLPVAERAAHLFGKDEGKATPVRRKKKPQMDLFKGLQVAEETEPTFGETDISHVGNTVLDRIHQSMILFAAGRSEALRRFLVEDGAGTDQRFWRLAQALSALYPGNTDEKRWVDGVLARKKGLGL